MNGPLFMFTLATIPYFASRVFGSVFWLALFARLQADDVIDLGGQFGDLQFNLALEYPPWFISNVFLGITLILALLESRADKNTDLARLFSFFDAKIKAFGEFIFVGTVRVKAAVAVTGSLAAGSTVVHAGMSPQWLWAVVAAVGVAFLARLRQSVLEHLEVMDEDDDLGIRSLLSWLEDLWVASGMILLMWLPVLSLVLAGGVLLSLILIERVLAAREKEGYVSCPSCETRNHPCAPKCFSCGQDLPDPKVPGLFGRPGKERCRDLETQKLSLTSLRRCPSCAHRLPKKIPQQTCPDCKTVVFANRYEFDSYLAFIRGQLPKTLAITGLFGAIPLIGLLPGIVYYKLFFTNRLRCYLPPLKGCVTRWLLRLVAVLLLAFQWIPILGAFTLPLLCLTNYIIYEKALRLEATSTFQE